MIHQDGSIPNAPAEVYEYLRKQRKRERKLTNRKEFLKARFLEMGGRLKLLEGRDEDLPCMVSSKNVYQLSTVRQVRDHLCSLIAITSEDFIKCYLELGLVQRNLRQDLETIRSNLHHVRQLAAN